MKVERLRWRLDAHLSQLSIRRLHKEWIRTDALLDPATNADRANSLSYLCNLRIFPTPLMS